MAMPIRSMTMRQLPGRARNAMASASSAVASTLALAQCRSIAKIAIAAADHGTKRPLTSPCSSFSARIDPAPTPIAKSASIIVTTCSLAKSTSFANTGNPETTMNAKSQNQEVARIGSRSWGRCVTCVTTSTCREAAGCAAPRQCRTAARLESAGRTASQ